MIGTIFSYFTSTLFSARNRPKKRHRLFERTMMRELRFLQRSRLRVVRVGGKNRPAARPDVHLLLGDEHVLERQAREHAVDRLLNRAPDRTDGAVSHVGAEIRSARMRTAEVRVEETASQDR